MSHPSEYALRVVEEFNKAHFVRSLKFRASELPAVAPRSRFGHRLLWTTTDGDLDIAPHRLMVGIARGVQGVYEVQIQQGQLIIASVILLRRSSWTSATHPPVMELMLQTNTMFRVYPLHVFADEPDTFFHNRGYGRLMLFFAALHCICAARTLRIECDSVVTAYILLQIFCPDSFTTADVEYNQDDYLTKLRQADADRVIADFSGFQRWFLDRKRSRWNIAVIYRVHATERNRAVFTDAIAKWNRDLVTSATDEQFMARFLHTPTR